MTANSALLLLLSLASLSTLHGQECEEEFSRFLNHDIVGAAQPFITVSTPNVTGCMRECLRSDGSCQAFLLEKHAFQRTSICRMFRTSLDSAQGHVHLKPKVPNSFPKFHYFELNRTCIALKESRPPRLEQRFVDSDNADSWGSWSGCTSTCGGGISLRVRVCRSCSSGREVERRPCNVQPCTGPGGVNTVQREVEGVWATWGPWNACSNPCEGSQSRARSCYIGGLACRAEPLGNVVEERERKECKCREFDFRAISNAAWVAWGRWSTCPNGCGPGDRTRTRQCTVPDACNGVYEQKQGCQGRLECKESSGGGEGVEVFRTTSTTPLPVPPALLWTQWRAWSPCSRTCGEGSRIRTRACPSGACPGRFTQTELCNEGACIVREVSGVEQTGDWELWGAWGGCSRTCDQGTRSRARSCRPGRRCFGSFNDVEICGFAQCPTDPVWSAWLVWSDCTVSCGEGVRTRNRSCSVDGCVGNTVDVEICTRSSCPQWQIWSSWSGCSRTCDNGSRFRTRVCDGVFCEGESRETEVCGPGACPEAPRWSEWGNWTECSRTCESGTRSRQRACSVGSACPGSALDIRVCNTQSCPSPTLQWGRWGSWSPCSASCGDALRSRQRTCTGGTLCSGSSVERQVCNLPDCPGLTTRAPIVAREGGEWSSWGSWALCSTTCGPGIRGRQRRCLTSPCVGDPIVGEGCNLGPCTLPPPPGTSTQGGWSNWNEWSSCSESCGSRASKFRSRFCLRPGTCSRELEAQDIPCIRLPACPSALTWSEWGFWGVCSCTEGVRSRARACSGASCPGAEEREQETCTNPDCQAVIGREQLVKGPWEEWSGWTECSETCGQGIRVRERACAQSAICRGKGFESEFCKLVECPGVGTVSGWSEWHAWSECFSSFGPGSVERIRIRVCPEGRWCPGASFQTADCADASARGIAGR